MGMDRRQVELKGGIAHFKNGNFTQALICFNKIKDAEGMKVPERVLLHDYWAATLERLNDLPEALIRSRSLITTDETSHKGYLRMAKILRLLGDQEAALKTYEMGLRRAKSGLEEIATQMRSVKVRSVKQSPEAADLFNLLPETVLHRILEHARMKKGTMSIVAMASKLASYFVKSHDGHAVGTKLVLLKDSPAVKIKHVLTSRPLCSKLVTTAANFTALLKMKGIPNRFSSVELTGQFGAMPPEPTEYHQTIFSNLRDLKFVKAKINNDEPILFFSKLQSLTRFYAYRTTIHVSRKTESSLLRKCTHLYGKDINWKGEGQDDGEDGLNYPRFKDFSPEILVWDRFQEPLPSERFFSKATDLGLQLYYFRKDEVQRGVKHDQITSFSITDPSGLEQMALSEIEFIPKFTYLKRLDLINLLFINDVASVQKLSFPHLEHLRLEHCHPVPKMKFWNMPNLKTCTYIRCDIMDVAQIPNLTTAYFSELLINLGGLHMDAKCFQVLANCFTKGRIHVLGVSNAHHFYQSNGIGRITSISQTQPFHHLIIDETQILPRIRRIWPLPTCIDPEL